MSIETQPAQTADPDSYTLLLMLQGTGAGVIPTILNNARGITIARTGAGLYTLTFGEEPGPTFQGLDGNFTDATPSNVFGWTAVGGVYTKRSGGVKAKLTVGIGNQAGSGADMAATSQVTLAMCFKLAKAKA